MSDYKYKWDRYRVRQRWIVTAAIVEFLAFIPFVGAVAVVSRKLLPGTDLSLFAALLWVALYLFTGSRLRSFPCPRCSKNFFGGILGDMRILFNNPRAFFGRECVYCGLPKYADAQMRSEYHSKRMTDEGANRSIENTDVRFCALMAFVGAVCGLLWSFFFPDYLRPTTWKGFPHWVAVPVNLWQRAMTWPGAIGAMIILIVAILWLRFKNPAWAFAWAFGALLGSTLVRLIH